MPASQPLKVMTFNLRYASPTPPNAWPQRRPVNREILRQYAPDVIGTQEGFYHQLRDIAADQPDYQWIGTGRGGGSRDEFAAIFYRPERLEPLEFDHFWLSDTPDVVGSQTWGNRCVRMATWVKFRDKPSGQEFYFCNTHLDHEVQVAREKGAALIAARLNALKTDLPVLLVGDFNADDRNNKAYDILTGNDPEEGGFTDTWYSAAQHIGQNYASFHNYEPIVPDGPHIDWILVRGPVKALTTQLVTNNIDGQYPSDHFPILATVRLGAK